MDTSIPVPEIEEVKPSTSIPVPEIEEAKPSGTSVPNKVQSIKFPSVRVPPTKVLIFLFGASLIIIGCVLIGVAIASLISAAGDRTKAVSAKYEHFDQPSPGGVCKNISESARTGVPLEVAPDPVAVNFCGLRHCKFKVGKCSNQCPLGFRTDDKECPVDCTCKETGAFQGDVQFQSDEVETVLKMFDGTSDSIEVLETLEVHKIWDQNKIGMRHRIPIRFATTFGNDSKLLVRSALAEFSRETCLDFVDVTFEEQHILIQNASKCSASFGRNPDTNVLNINEELCTGAPAIQHLVMHVLGFHHEHTRPDRDTYITIHENNIQPGYEGAFTKLSPAEALDLEVEYNTKSIMHFAFNAFSNKEDVATISGKSGLKIRGENPDDFFTGLQETDKVLINRRYQCEGYGLNVTWSPWGAWMLKENNKKCIRYRKCVNSKGRNSVGCPGDSMEYDETHIKCADDPSGRAKVSGRSTGMFGDTKYPSNWLCMNGEILSGKFNGDRRDDIICVYPDGWIRLYLASYDGNFKRLDWEGQTQFCVLVNSPGQRLVGDVNGDGYDDLICRKKDGTVEVTLLIDGRFPNQLEWSGKIPTCVNQDVATIADMNGDGKADFICGDADKVRFREVYMNVYQL